LGRRPGPASTGVVDGVHGFWNRQLVSREDYIRLAGWVVLAAAVLIAFLIPVKVCVLETCRTRAVWEQDSAVWEQDSFGLSLLDIGPPDYQWPLRVGILAAGVLGVISAYLITAPRRAENE